MISTTLDLALISTGVLGFRHGFDYDHIAAITDITSVEPSRPRAMRMGLLYVLGHASTVAALGSLVIFFQRSLPASIDSWAERAVGLTLVILGLYVLGSLLRDNAVYIPRSRAAILIDFSRWLLWRIRAIFGSESSVEPVRRSGPYSRTSVFVIGIIHGLGAETPSQLLLFLLSGEPGWPRSRLSRALGISVWIIADEYADDGVGCWDFRLQCRQAQGSAICYCGNGSVQRCGRGSFSLRRGEIPSPDWLMNDALCGKGFADGAVAKW
jgi:hypothetical protein